MLADLRRVVDGFFLWGRICWLRVVGSERKSRFKAGRHNAEQARITLKLRNLGEITDVRFNVKIGIGMNRFESWREAG